MPAKYIYRLLNLYLCPRHILGIYQHRHCATQPVPHLKEHRNADMKMSAWQIHSYGGLEELRLSDSARIPKLSNPDDILVQVLASSVNPLDVAMIGGYGSSLLNTFRQVENCDLSYLEFPLSLGRDFSGKIVRKGYNVSDFKVGDEVWGVVPPHYQGSHAQKVLINKSMVHLKPTNLTHLEAGSLLYTAVTAWSSLKISGDLFLSPAEGKKILVLGGSGGVGTAAIQLLKAWGAQVYATCSTDAIPLVESLGADGVIDYTQPDFHNQLEQLGRCDIIYDAAGIGSAKAPEYVKHLKDLKLSKYITLKSPMLYNVDQYGVIGGMFKNVVDIIGPNIKTNLVSPSSTVRWGFFIPCADALRDISCLVCAGKIVPIIEKVFPFEELPCAYEKVAQGHLRGKIVIEMPHKSEPPNEGG